MNNYTQVKLRKSIQNWAVLQQSNLYKNQNMKKLRAWIDEYQETRLNLKFKVCYQRNYTTHGLETRDN